MSAVAYRRRAFLDVETGGLATISGTVRILTAPAGRPVYLLEQDTLRLRRATDSNPTTGAYSFPGVAEGREWLVLALDTAGGYNAVVADRVAT
jgi:hypothetical protein